MADIQQKSVIKLIDIVKSFNDKVWVRLASEIGALYSNNTPKADGSASVILEQDTAPATTGNITITSKGRPQMNIKAYIGVNTNTKNENNYIKERDALPSEHMQTLSSNVRKFFTLKLSDIETSDNIIAAKEVYEACYEVLRQLLCIRPLTTIWNHEGLFPISKAEFKYHAVYKDSNDPALDEATINGKKVPAIDHARHAETGFQGSYYEWAGYSKGANFSIFSYYDEAKPAAAKIVSRTIESGTKAAAVNMNEEINAFWRAWEEKCKTANRFTYTYHTCHMSCHSSCYCYGARHRR